LTYTPTDDPWMRCHWRVTQPMSPARRLPGRVDVDREAVVPPAERGRIGAGIGQRAAEVEDDRVGPAAAY
jgi:hypothetical protein